MIHAPWVMSWFENPRKRFLKFCSGNILWRAVLSHLKCSNHTHSDGLALSFLSASCRIQHKSSLVSQWTNCLLGLGVWIRSIIITLYFVFSNVGKGSPHLTHLKINEVELFREIYLNIIKHHELYWILHCRKDYSLCWNELLALFFKSTCVLFQKNELSS